MLEALRVNRNESPHLVERPVSTITAAVVGDFPDKLLNPGAQLERFLVVAGGAGPFPRDALQLKVLGSVSVCPFFQIDQLCNQLFLAHFQRPFQQSNRETVKRTRVRGNGLVSIRRSPDGHWLRSGTKSGPWTLDPTFYRFLLSSIFSALLYGSAYFRKT